MKNWRRSARTQQNPPALLSAQFVLSTRVLTLTFDRFMVAGGTFSSTVLRVDSGTNRYDWQSTTLGSGFSLIFQMLTPSAQVNPALVTWNNALAIIRDTRGTLWPIGTYPVTLI